MMDSFARNRQQRAMAVCKHATYSGRVQGVGFRYTTERLAEQFPVMGYVRNLRNGDVEVVAQGEPQQVDAFLTALARRIANYIVHSRVQDETPGDYQDF